METAIEIIGIACFAALWTYISNIRQTLEYKIGFESFKPFNCEKCMGWWLGLIYFTYQQYPIADIQQVINIIIFASICSIGAYYIVKYA